MLNYCDDVGERGRPSFAGQLCLLTELNPHVQLFIQPIIAEKINEAKRAISKAVTRTPSGSRRLPGGDLYTTLHYWERLLRQYAWDYNFKTKSNKHTHTLFRQSATKPSDTLRW